MQYKNYIRLGVLLAGGVLSLLSLSAQKQKTPFDYEYLKSSDAWLASENASGISNWVVQRASVAEITFNKTNGGFINYSESNNSYQYGALCESYFRLNKKTVVFGKVEYSRFEGKNMGGSAFIDPYYNPVNIVEYADSTAGNKVKETYHLIGALSTKLTDHLLFGAKTDYTTVSYYKIRDLRHINDWMDLLVTGGLRYNNNQSIDVGINYTYRRTTESIAFESAGNSGKQFNSLIDFGAFYGEQERYGESGYTSGGLMFNQFQGGAVQINLFPKKDFSFFNELWARHRSGYYGVKSATSVVYTEHKGNLLGYNGVLSLKRATVLHQLKLNWDAEFLKNYEKSYRSETSTGGVKNYFYYGKNEVLRQNRVNFSAGYTGNFQVKDNTPVWIVDALFAVKTNNEKVSMYPAYRKQQINQFLSEVSSKRNIQLKQGVLRVQLSANYGFGTGYAAQDGIYDTNGTSSAKSLDQYLYREFDYLTAKKVGGQAAVRYTAEVKGGKTKWYGEVGYEATKALNVDYIGDYRGNVNVKVGYLF
jgi:hypothetical protein